MRAYVFPDAALAPVAARFVWLSIDAEDARNAAFAAKFPVEGFPTLLVIDPHSEAPTRRWPGSVTAPELARRLGEVALAMSPASRRGEAERALAAGSAQANLGNGAAAEVAFEQAMKSAEPGTPTHAQAVELLLASLQEAGKNARCVEVAEAELKALPPGAARANAASAGLSCALELAEGDAGRSAALAALGGQVESLAADPGVVMLADDRSSMLETLVDARKAQGDAAGAARAARAWRDFLETEAAKAPTAEARAVFDAHRLLAYSELHEVEKAVPMLRDSERDLPSDYNPPHRLAMALLKLQRPREALVEVERAERLVYGARTVRVLLTLADVKAALHDPQGVAAALARAERAAMETSSGSSRQALQRAIRRKREELSKEAR